MAEKKNVVRIDSGTNAANNTVTVYETPSGQEVSLTLNFLLLYRMKAKYPTTYAKYNEIIMKGMKDVFDGITILYTAYLCANIDKDGLMSYEDFIGLMDDDVNSVMKQAGALMGRKKKAPSETHS